jgi:hypothetical protein
MESSKNIQFEKSIIDRYSALSNLTVYLMDTPFEIVVSYNTIMKKIKRILFHQCTFSSEPTYNRNSENSLISGVVGIITRLD